MREIEPLNERILGSFMFAALAGSLNQLIQVWNTTDAKVGVPKKIKAIGQSMRRKTSAERNPVNGSLNTCQEDWAPIGIALRKEHPASKIG